MIFLQLEIPTISSWLEIWVSDVCPSQGSPLGAPHVYLSLGDIKFDHLLVFSTNNFVGRYFLRPCKYSAPLDFVLIWFLIQSVTWWLQNDDFPTQALSPSLSVGPVATFPLLLFIYLFITHTNPWIPRLLFLTMVFTLLLYLIILVLKLYPICTMRSPSSWFLCHCDMPPSFLWAFSYFQK